MSPIWEVKLKPRSQAHHHVFGQVRHRTSHLDVPFVQNDRALDAPTRSGECLVQRTATLVRLAGLDLDGNDPVPRLHHEVELADLSVLVVREVKPMTCKLLGNGVLVNRPEAYVGPV